MRHTLPLLSVNRFGVYYVRVQRAGVDVCRSLRTKNPAEALRLGHLFNLWLMSNKTNFDFKTLNVENIKKLDIVLPDGTQLNNIQTNEDEERARRLLQALAGITPTQTPQQTPQQAKNELARVRERFDTVAAEYLKECKLVQVQKTIDEKRGTYTDFSKLFNNGYIDTFDTQSIATYKNRLLAQNCTALRVNKRLANLRELFSFAVSNSKISSNPVLQDLKVGKDKTLKAKIKSYEPFTHKELLTIFNPGPYKLFNKKPEYFFCPLLAFYTGARLEELASLTPSQIVKDEDTQIFYLDIIKAKNTSSVRKIPLPAKVIDTGFLKYVESVKDKEIIFPNLKLTINGYGKNVGRRFGEYLDSENVSIKSPLKVFHSFRHTFINRMTELHANEILLMALVGHYEQSNIDLRSVHIGTYNKGKHKKLSVLKEVIDTFDIEIPNQNFYKL